MTLHLLDGEPLADGVERVARQEVERALEALTTSEATTDPWVGVHDARRSLKRVRALLRLIAPALGQDAFRTENRDYRDVGRALAPLRDAEALATTVEALLARTVRDDPETLERLRQRRIAVGRRTLARTERKRIVRRLRDARGRIGTWAPRNPAWTDALEGLRRSYAEGRRALRRVRSSPGNATHHHEWRKRGKDLRHQLEFLQGAWPAVLGATAEELHRLTTLLGDANDAALVIRTLEETPALVGGPGDAHVLTARAVDLRNGAWQEARPLGGRIWAEAPAEFSRRIDRYRVAWRE